MNAHRRTLTTALLATALITVAGAQAPGRPGMRPGMDASGGPVVGDPVPRIGLQRLETAGDTAKPGAREPLADHAKKRPVVLIFSSFT